jgi:P2X purinoceptor 4
MTRQLIKAYGIRFIISVTGQAARFNLMPLLLTLGSGLGLLSLSSIVVDLILLNITEKKELYREIKEFNYKDQVRKFYFFFTLIIIFPNISNF